MPPVIPFNKFSKIEEAAHSGAFGINPLPQPSIAQIEAGNYKKGKINLYGLRIAIEQPANSYRTGIDKDGTAWSCRLAANYGYFLGSIGNDNDHIDCFIGSYPQAEYVYIINQFVNGKFDEHKIMVCFVDEQDAIQAYKTSYSQNWNGLESIVKASINQFKHWLRFANKSVPATKEQLPIEIKKMMQLSWDASGLPVGADLSTVLYELRRSDGGNLLLDAATIDDFNHDYADCMVSDDYLDSLNMPYSLLRRKSEQLGMALSKSGKTLKLIESSSEITNPDITKPFKKYGVLMVSVVYSLSDGQTVTIIFHNPDSTPSKIQPTDTMIAWKWVLNKKDITAVVAPENGKDIAPMKVAERIINLAEKNSEAFQRANKNLSEQIKQIDDLSTEINDLGMVLAGKNNEYATVKAEYDDWQIKQAISPQPVAVTQPIEPPVTVPPVIEPPVIEPEAQTVDTGFTPTHTYHDTDIGEDVPVAKNEDGNWQNANGIEYMGIDGEVEPIGAGNEDVQPVAAQEPTPEQGIDPVAKANIESANISAAIKKKAIAYLNENPTSHQLAEKETPAIKKAKDVILSNLQVALKSEIMSLSPLFHIDTGNEDRIVIGDQSTEDHLVIEIARDKVSFMLNNQNGTSKNLFDSTKTLEDLKSWGFALPFDLDVKAFVANVIKPVVDEFLAKQSTSETVEPEVDVTEPETTEIEPQQSGDEMETEIEIEQPEETPVEPADTAIEEPQDNSFDADIEALRGLIGTPDFSDELDNLLDKLEAAGVDSDYESVISDIINQDAQAESAKAA